MKAFCGDDGKIRLFRPIENFNRMNNSAERICLPTFDNEEMRQCLHRYVELEKDWVPQGRGCSLYLRPTMIGTEVSLFDKSCLHLLGFTLVVGYGTDLDVTLFFINGYIYK